MKFSCPGAISSLVILAMFSVANSAKANLGDSEEQLIARYGPEIIKTKDQPGNGAVALDRLSFNKSGFQIDVLLFSGVSSEESVYHRPYAPLTEEEIKTLLDANRENQSWKMVGPQQELQHGLHSLEFWQRTDGTVASLEGTKDKPRLLFHVQSLELANAEQKARQQ